MGYIIHYLLSALAEIKVKVKFHDQNTFFNQTILIKIRQILILKILKNLLVIINQREISFNPLMQDQIIMALINFRIISLQIKICSKI